MMALGTVSMVALGVSMVVPLGVSMVGLVLVIRVIRRTSRHIHVFFNVILLGEIAFHGNLVQSESDCEQGQKGQKEKRSCTNHVGKGECEIRAC